MKRILVIFIITILFGCASNLKPSVKDSYKSKVIESYNYLIENNLVENNVVVSDTIIGLESVTFSRFLYSEESNLTKNKFTHLLRQQDLSMKHKDYFYPIKKTLHNNTKVAKEIIYFSQARDNYLTIEVFQYKDITARQPYFMGQSVLYLFVFNNSGSIDKVYSEMIFYN